MKLRRILALLAVTLLMHPTPSCFAQTAPSVTPPWALRDKAIPIPLHQSAAAAATPTPPGLYVAMGDSITFGTGVKDNCQAFPSVPVDIDAFCPQGTSYAILVARALRKQGIAGRFMNLGINGARVERVIAEEVPYLPAETTLVTLYVGTNDVREIHPEKHAAMIETYERHYVDLLAAIHQRAAKARIVLINFPNERYLAASYHFPAEAIPAFDQSSQTIARFIDSFYPKYSVADTICNPSSYDATKLANATVHPNEAGAADLAATVVKAVVDPGPPPTSCQWLQATGHSR